MKLHSTNRTFIAAFIVIVGVGGYLAILTNHQKSGAYALASPSASPTVQSVNGICSLSTILSWSDAQNKNLGDDLSLSGMTRVLSTNPSQVQDSAGGGRIDIVGKNGGPNYHLAVHDMTINCSKPFDYVVTGDADVIQNLSSTNIFHGTALVNLEFIPSADQTVPTNMKNMNVTIMDYNGKTVYTYTVNSPKLDANNFFNANLEYIGGSRYIIT